MNLIIKDKIPMFMVGYPTMGDKYNITGGILAGSDPVKFGDLVMFADGGYYKKVNNATSVNDIAGFVMATNVKLAEGFATNVVQVNPHEAFNLVLGGSWLAVETEEADGDDIKPNGAVYVDLSNGKLYASTGEGHTNTLPGVVFTGTYELHGTKVVAEIIVK